MWWNELVGLGLHRFAEVAIGLSQLAYPSVAADEEVQRERAGPVVLIGGFGETAPCLQPMAHYLERLGYDVTVYTLGAGMGCSQRTADSLVRRVRALAETTGEPVRLVGHSRGGQLARAVSSGAAGSVSHLVTIGTPSGLQGPTRAMAAVLWGFAVAGSIGVPGLYRMGCLAHGACCVEFRAAVAAPCPADVAFTSISSRRDQAVPWSVCQVPGAANVEVWPGHVAQLTAADVQRAVGDALARPRRSRSEPAA